MDMTYFTEKNYFVWYLTGQKEILNFDQLLVLLESADFINVDSVAAFMSHLSCNITKVEPLYDTDNENLLKNCEAYIYFTEHLRKDPKQLIRNRINIFKQELLETVIKRRWHPKNINFDETD